jgi:hypothetical protein
MIPKLIRNLIENPSQNDFLEEALMTFTEEYGDIVIIIKILIYSYLNLWINGTNH